jgi:hypothetical protein
MPINYWKNNNLKCNKNINSLYSNPFVLGQDIPEELFCDRDEETRTLVMGKAYLAGHKGVAASNECDEANIRT